MREKISRAELNNARKYVEFYCSVNNINLVFTDHRVRIIKLTSISGVETILIDQNIPLAKWLPDVFELVKQPFPPKPKTDESIQFYDANQEVTGEPFDADYFFRIPADQAYLLGYDSEIVAAVKHGSGRNTVIAYKPNLELLFGQGKKDEALNLYYLESGGEWLLDFKIVGEIVAVASYDSKVLRFGTFSGIAQSASAEICDVPYSRPNRKTKTRKKKNDS